jgi:hypothetical protein
MSEDPKYKTWAGLAEAFNIFAKYGEGKWMTQAEHDVIYAGPDHHDVSQEDKDRLEALGWHFNKDGEGEDVDCFYYFT